MAALSPTCDREWIGEPMASLAIASSRLHQHQMFGHDRAGLTRGGCRVQAPAAHELQACKLGRGVDPRSLSRILHWLPSSSLATDRRTFLTSLAGVRRNFPAARQCAERGAFHSMRIRACQPFARHTLPNEHAYQGLAHSDHVSSLSLKSRFRPEQYGRRFQAWRYPIQIIRCPQ